jgi:hypothetical protein
MGEADRAIQALCVVLGILYPDRYGREKKVVILSFDLRRKERSGMLSGKGCFAQCNGSQHP